MVQAVPLQQPPPSSAAAPPPTHTAAPQNGRRPLAQPNLNFTIKPKMPRRVLAASAAPSYVPTSPTAPKAAQPQFVSVQSRPHVPAQAPSPASAAQQQGSGWPASLREYVTRALKTALADAGQAAAMHNALREVISEADRAGERWSRDWDTLPLPDLTAGSHGPSTSHVSQTQPGEAAGARAEGLAGTAKEDFPDWVQTRRDSAAGR